MSRSTSISEETIRIPSSAEISWRTRRMVSLGAGEKLAAEIADTDVDLHDIERMLKAGCALDLAWTIMQPITKRPTVTRPAEPASADD